MQADHYKAPREAKHHMQLHSSSNKVLPLTEAIAGFWRKATRATVSDHHRATEMGRHRSPITPAALMQQASTAPKLPLP